MTLTDVLIAVVLYVCIYVLYTYTPPHTETCTHTHTFTAIYTNFIDLCRPNLQYKCANAHILFTHNVSNSLGGVED